MSVTVRAIFSGVNTLAEVKAAVDSLPGEQKEELLCFLAMRLRKECLLLTLRVYSDEELAAMLVDDEAEGARFRRVQ